MNLRRKQDPFSINDFKYFIIDTDVGGDDAQALMTGFHFAKKFDKKFLGITSVNGNTTVDNVITNILITQAVSDEKIPVYKGASFSMTGENLKDGYFSEDGLGTKQNKYIQELGDKIDRSLVQETPAYKFIVESAVKYKGQIALVCLGPLTNLALAYHYENQIVNYFSNIALMGSSDNLVGLSHFFAAQFNIGLDPEAAHIVFSSFKNIVVLSFDTSILNINPTQTLEIFNCEKTKKSRFISDIYEKIKKMHDPSVCDPLALFPLFRPESVVSGMKLQMLVELKGKRTRGATKVNWFNKDKQKENCYIVKNFDRKILMDELYESYQ